MNINRKWASEIGADGNPIYAPKDAIVVGGRTVLGPKDKHYETAGYKRVIDTPPSVSPREGYHWEVKGWEASEGRICRVYEEVANPPEPPRTLSKLKCVAALMQAGVWSEVKAWIEAAGLYDLYLAAQDFREDNEYFVRGREQLQAVLGWSDEQVEAILKECAIGY